jgi:predicted NACHT family NTPase
MAKRSLYASAEGTLRARQALARKRWTQQLLAEEVGLKTRQPIGRFLAGKTVDRSVFMEVCFQLGLDWQEIAAQTEDAAPEQIEEHQAYSFNINTLVQGIRSQCYEKLQAQCGTLQMLDVPQPIDIADIYIDVNILEEIPNRQWLEIPDLLQGLNLSKDKFDPLGMRKIAPERVSGFKAVAKYSKLMVLGKPGTGKTTFLKFVALQCNQGKFQPHRLPIFIYLKYFVEDARDLETRNVLSVEQYICQELATCGVSAEDVKTLLNHGRLLILLDGLDEVPESDSHLVLKQIRQFFHNYYKNQFALSCRTTSVPYRFQGFTEVEIAELTDTQIAAFAKKYFVAIAKNDRKQGLIKAYQFIEQLGHPENRQILELAVTPLLLTFTCLVFQSKSNFPSKRAKLYEEGLNILLVRWKLFKGIRQDDAYEQLSLANKIKLLNKVGALTFEQNDYFFEQSKIQQYIADYLRLLPNAETDAVALQLDSEAVLKSIEWQHGLLVERSRRIYSFSHLTFQEYFTARHITAETELKVDGSKQLLAQRGEVQAEASDALLAQRGVSVSEAADAPNVATTSLTLSEVNLQPGNLQQLASHITEKRWHEVFLLATGMLRKADDLLRLMKQQIDILVASDENLLQFIRWISQKSQSVSAQYKPAAVRAFYFSLALTLDHYFTCALSPGPASGHFPALPYFPLRLFLSLSLALQCDFDLHRNFAFNFNVQTPDLPYALGLSRLHILDQTVNCALHFDLALAPDQARELQRSLEALKAQLPDREEGAARFKIWWQQNRHAWTEQLKAVMRTHHSADHNWHFSKEQTRSLYQYYDANKLLIDCLKSDCHVSAAVQAEIEERLLLPAGDILQD